MPIQLFAVSAAGANEWNGGDNQGPPDYESVAKYSEQLRGG